MSLVTMRAIKSYLPKVMIAATQHGPGRSDDRLGEACRMNIWLVIKLISEMLSETPTTSWPHTKLYDLFLKNP